MRKIVVEVNKNNNENSMSLIRRFTRKVQETGIIQKVKGKRYNTRALSKLAVKRGKLKRLAKTEEFEKLFKLGKVTRGRQKKGKK